MRSEIILSQQQAPAVAMAIHIHATTLGASHAVEWLAQTVARLAIFSRGRSAGYALAAAKVILRNGVTIH